MTRSPDDSLFTLGTRCAAVILALGVVTVCLNLGGETLTRHEVYAAEPAREMLDGGTWLVQSFAGEPRLAKPPTMSWLIAGTMKLVGGPSEYAARLPAAVSGVLLGLILASTAARFGGRRFGLLTGLITVTSYYVQLQGRLSEADLPMTTVIAGAMSVFAVCCLPRPGAARLTMSNDVETKPAPVRGGFNEDQVEYEPRLSDARLSPSFANVTVWSVAFYALVGFAFLLKGVGPVVVIPACVLWAMWGIKPFRGQTVSITAKRLLLNPVGIVVGITLIAAWPLAAWWHYPNILHTWRYETGQRLAGTQEGRIVTWGQYAKHFFDYGWMLLGLALPWTPAVLICLIGSWRKAVFGTPLGRFGVCYMVPGLIFFTLSAWRHQHYIMPVAPPLAWAAAYGTVQWIAWRERQPARRGPVLVGCGLIAAATAYGAVVLLSKHQAPLAGIAGIVGLAAIVVLLLDEAKKAVAGIGVMIAAAVLAVIVLQFHVLPRHDGSRPLAEFARAVNRAVPAGQRVTLLGLGESQIAFYLDAIPGRVDDADQFVTQNRRVPASHAGGDWFYLCDSDHALKLRSVYRDADIILRGSLRKTVRENDDDSQSLVLVRCRY